MVSMIYFKLHHILPKILRSRWAGCRTQWFDMDDPTGRGDYETFQQLLVAFPGAVCSQPMAIEAMTTSGVPALQTEDTFQV